MQDGLFCLATELYVLMPFQFNPAHVLTQQGLGLLGCQTSVSVSIAAASSNSSFIG
jgi:hypothetical protein